MIARRLGSVVTVVLALGAVLVAPAGAGAGQAPRAAAAVQPAQDPFYRYSGSVPLGRIAPGTVLATRSSVVHLATLPTPITMTQLLYRTSDQDGRPVVTVTSVLRPPVAAAVPRLLSYQSFYDSLTPECEPSYVLNGGVDRGLVVSTETPVLISYLVQGYTITVSDFEGQDPTFATGPRYGQATLDGIRATFNSRSVGLPAGTNVAMLGYSGGAIASEWATEMAPRYAPEINRRLVGTAIGGVFVDPIHNLRYVDGSLAWSGVMPMALIGIARAYHVDLDPYLSDYGRKVMTQLSGACIANALGHYPGLTFARLVKPQYADPESIPPLKRIVNTLIMGRAGTPTVPLYIRQGTGGVLEGTFANLPGIGPGDGVMVAGDVRTLARQYCDRGVRIDYGQAFADHIAYGAVVLVQAAPWISARFGSSPAPSNCSRIAPGNSIAPLP